MSLIFNVQAFLEEHGIAQLEGNKFVLLDDQEPIGFCRPPASLLQGPLGEGLDWLQAKKPLVVLLLSHHVDGADFTRLARQASSMLRNSALVGVEAVPSASLINGIPEPALCDYNFMMKAFQEKMFAWMRRKSKLMLPCEPATTTGAWDRAEALFGRLRNNELSDYPPDVRGALLHVLYVYCGIFRAWGLVAQFGLWLRHPTAVRLMDKLSVRVPLVLGAAHTYEYDIFRRYLGLDVVKLAVEREVYDPNIEDYYVYYRQHVERGNIPTADLDVRFPEGD